MAKSKQISSIDIGSTKITTLVAQIREEDSSKIHIVGAATSPSRGIRKGQIVNIDEAVESIVESVESAERMAGYNVARAWVSVDGTHIASQNSQGVVAISDPHGEISGEDVRRVLEAARAISLPTSSEILHVIPRSFSVDSQQGVRDPIGMTGVRLEVETHIVTSSTTALKNLSKCVGEVGCDVSGLAFGGLVSSLAVLTDTEKELGVVCVDIGGGTTDIVIYVDGALSYSSVLPVGARNVTNDLAIGLRISLESAEKIKVFISQSRKDKEDEIDLSPLALPEELKTISYKTLVEGIIRPRLNELFQMISSEIKKSNLAGLTPAGLVICGGGALTVGLVDSAKRILSMPVRIGWPTGLTGLIDEIESPAFAASVGLLKHSLDNAEEAGLGNFLDKIPLTGLMGKISSALKSLLP
ncbi:MAG: Cell division protein ftsA [Candidatus Amesbacteria bacterium GW2011_GWB1_47_26]|uniref:Cell division protein FtsA n=1 Tax=Candidatus Amesbacteria bacterium GW2011_GWC2_45_19 TaxID=1618366 RepID=A0A0G1M5A3_9BACT|nr:MAG: Cell division protein ftsA [Candidatus Amesbacteria bacterium GW2011_GWC2_45_19]KKU38604.1 MAG: Cell division protein ftsA [Candidatus Amesbacteria bacterium GW2011_GWA1_46_35]KKU69440.1 MAG: Cell division protein ftsA [Microgenomates group bacterium GW2011_GWC1_47_20]KKU73922.1 MAG: Cell division protein ftsA [Candidatus Amesbacteria bacterium GW2011_GWB1_47_26]